MDLEKFFGLLYSTLKKSNFVLLIETKKNVLNYIFKIVITKVSATFYMESRLFFFFLPRSVLIG